VPPDGRSKWHKKLLKEIALARKPVKSTDAPLRFADFWQPLILLGLVILGAEWWLYARRS
jgi:hypothetical protein